ncbi:hypothetical protein BV497_16325 [Fulvimonas soli]|nr:hypothetical protein BV497_16325 [Fulvimonas soli]
MANEDGELKCIFGTLRDASPDVWKSRIIEKHAGRSDLAEVDFLLNSPEGRAGALSFGRGDCRRMLDTVSWPARYSKSLWATELAG